MKDDHSGVVGHILAGSGRVAGDPESCKAVRFSDVGWTDITATTAIASEILKGLGYTPKITVLSVPVTYASMKNKDIDVFLGNWQPSMENDRKPYIEDKSVVEIGANLPTGAKYTLAVPQYTYDKGLKDFADIAKFKDSLEGQNLRHRARQRRQPPRPRHHQGRQVRPEELPARRIERAGHARRGAARDEPQGGRRVPRLGAPSDERQFQDPVSDRRRRQLRPEFRRRDRLHQRARRLRREMPERRQARSRSSSSLSTLKTW